MACGVDRYHSDSFMTLSATITPSSPQNSNLSLNKPPSWPIPVLKVSLRQDTVTALYERLQSYALIQVMTLNVLLKSLLTLA
jgi:hypothetical protein